jgi:hypothetical protein
MRSISSTSLAASSGRFLSYPNLYLLFAPRAIFYRQGRKCLAGVFLAENRGPLYKRNNGFWGDSICLFGLLAKKSV